MDYPLGDISIYPDGRSGCVLIPILMDYPLGEGEELQWYIEPPQVLIPILMDYPLGDSKIHDKSPGRRS